MLDHVDEEEVLLAELVDRRVERDDREGDPEPEEELARSRGPEGRAAQSVRDRRR